MMNVKHPVFVLLFVIVVIAILSPTKLSVAQNTLYKSLAKNFATDHSFVSFDVFTEKQNNDSTLWIRHDHVILNYDDKEPVIFSELIDESGRISRSYWMDKEKYIYINHDNREITRYDNKKALWDDYHCHGLMEYIPSTFDNLSYYLYPLSNKIKGGLMMYTISNITNQEPVKVNGKSYMRFQGTSSMRTSYNPKDGNRVKVYEKAYFFINQETKALDSVSLIQYPIDYENWKTFVSVRNVVYSNKQQYMDDVFDLNKAKYRNYSRHDCKNPPLSKAYSSEKNMTDALLEYPLVDLNGNKSSIAENDGWLLLNFWTINCAPCIQHLKDYKHEKDSLGHRILENEGIRILAINQKSDNMELIGDIAEKTDTRDIMYSGKGIGGTIELPYLGYFYLISPDKEVVYDSSNLGDYSELLKAKADYEKQHQKE